MKVFGLVRATFVGVGLLAAGLSVSAQTKVTQVTTAKAVAPQTVVTRISSSSASGAHSTRVIVRHKTAPAAIQKAPAKAKAIAHAGKIHSNITGPPTVVNSVNFGNAQVAGTPVTMTLTYPATPAASIQAAVSTTVPNGGVAPGSASDYIFFGNSNVEFGGQGGGQPSNLTNFTVSTLSNVEYPGNGNYTKVIAPGGTTAFTTGTVTENPTNYPNTTPHTQLLATFSPLTTGSFSVYILDGNTDGNIVGNSSVGLGVNGGTAVVSTSHFLSGTNEFTQFNVTNASSSDVFQVYATTSVNNYPTIGGLTFVPEAPNPLTSNLMAAATANIDFAVVDASCNSITCTANVTFTPHFPGLAYDSISLTDSSGNLVYQTYVYGNGLAPQFGYELGDETDFFDYVNNPMNVAIGPDERLYYTSSGSNTIFEFARDFSSSSSVSLDGLASPSGIVVDGSNTLYVADQANNVIFSYTSAGVQSTVATTPLSGPSQLAIDGTGALYIADTGNGRVIKIDNQGNETTIASGLVSPVGVAVDSAGDVFYTNEADSNGQIYELRAGASSAFAFQPQINQTPGYMAVDASGSVFLETDQGLNIFRAGNQIQYSATGADVAYGVALDRNGDLLVTNPLKNEFTIDVRSASNFILNASPGTQTNGTVTISNTGNEPLNFSSFTVTGPQYSIDGSNNQCAQGGPLAPNTTCNVVIDFTPPEAQRYTDTMIVTSDSLNAPGTTDPFSLAGNGNGDDSTTALTAYPNPVASGNPVTLLITVQDSGTSFTPMGSVTVMDGGTSIGSADLSPGTLAGSSTAQFTIPSLSIGSHDLTVAFPGDFNVSPSTSNTVTVNATDGPPPPNGGISVTSQNFGTVPVGQFVSMRLDSSREALSVSIGSDFTVFQAGCPDDCHDEIQFAPQFPGLRGDVVTEMDDTDTVVGQFYVYGTGTGPQLGFDFGVDIVFNPQFAQPTAVAFDFEDNFYIADPSINKVFEDAGDSAFELPIPNLGKPTGLAVDASQTVYVADQSNSLIRTYNGFAGSSGTLVTSQLSGPTGVAVDVMGTVYITDTGNNRIIKVDKLGNETTLASSIASLGAIALDSAGNVYYATTTSPGAIVELPAAGGQPIQISNSVNDVHGLAVDASGRVYYADDNGISILNPSTGTSEIGISGSGFPIGGVALDGVGDVLFTQPTRGNYQFSFRSQGTTTIFANAGVSTQGTAVVANTGNTPLTLEGLSLTGTVFTLDPANPCVAGTVIPAGGTCTVVIDYLPPFGEQDNEILTVFSNSRSMDSANIFAVYGSATGPMASTTTTLTVAPSAVQVGNTVRMLVTVTNPRAIAPTGSVSFMDGSSVLGSADLTPGRQSGTATAEFDTSSLSVGTHSISASYTGDSNVQGSVSNSQQVNVTSGAPPPNGGIPVTSQNFGSVVVGQSTSMSINYPTSPANAVITAVAGRDFSVSNVTCSTTCTATITFAPIYPGVRSDVIAVTSGGNLVAQTFVYGTGTGPQFGFDPHPDTQVQGPIPNPTGVAVAPNGLEYISDTGTSQVWVVGIDSTTALPIVNLGTPAGVAVDGNGTVYVADQKNNLIVTYNVNSQAQGTVATSQLSEPTGLAVDGSGNLFITDKGNNRILKIDNQGNETVLASDSVQSPRGIALDSAGNVFYADEGNGGEIIQLPSGGGSPTTVASSLGTVRGIAVDASGEIYYSSGTGLSLFGPGGNVLALNFATAIYGVALAPDGDIYVTLPTAGQYYVSVRGKAGYSFAQNVGTTTPGTRAISNTGNAPLTVNNLSITGTAFTLDPSNQCIPGTVLAAGISCNIVVDFTPVAAVNYQETLTATSNSLNQPGSTNALTLFGQGIGGPPETTTTLSAAPTAVQSGKTVRLFVTVADQGGFVPTGSVTFMDGGTALASVNLTQGTNGSSAIAEFDTASLSVGSHNIFASYPGDSNVQASSSNQVAVTVTSGAPPPNGGVTVTSQNFGSVAVGQSISMNVVFPGGGNPTFDTSNGEDFKITGFNCDSTCAVTVSFTPIFPGARTDSITKFDESGIVLAKAYVYGTATGPLFGFNPGNSAVDSTWQSPNGIAVGQNGVAFLSDTATNQVYELASNAPPLKFVNLGTPGSVAVDGSGTIYVVDQTKGLIVTYNPQTLVQGSVTPTNPLSNPAEIGVDGAGSLYIADTGNNRVVKIDNQGVQSSVAIGLSSPTGVAVDAAGNVYYSDNNDAGEIVEVPVNGDPIVRLGTSLGSVLNITLDAAGSVYYTGGFSGIRIITPSRQNFGFTGQLTGNLNGIAIGPNGDIYTTQESTGHEEQLSRAGINFFSSTPVGVSVQHGGPQVMNTGNTPLTISNLAFASGTAFTIDSGSICQNGLALSPGGLCNTLVDFLPTAAQPYSDTLTFTSNSDNVAGSTNMDAEAGNGTGSVIIGSRTTVSASTNTPVQGQSITLRALVSAQSDTPGAIPTGSVDFFDGTTDLGTVTLNPSGVAGTASASLNTSPLSVGTHNITAVYSGDSTYSGSTSAPQTVTVSPPPATTYNSVNFGSVPVGQSVQMEVDFSQGVNYFIRGVNDPEFTNAQSLCNTTCTEVYNFTPQYPGAREYALNVYDQGGNLVARTYLYGVGTGPQFGFDFSTNDTFNDIQQPTAIALGPDGAPYITDTATKMVYKAGNGSTAALPITGLVNPTGIAVDGVSKIYVADRDNNAIVTYDQAAGFGNVAIQGTLATSQLFHPTGVAVDATGAVYITDTNNSRVIKVDNQGTETTLASGVANLGPIAVDGAGDVFYATTTTGGGITELPAGGGSAIVLASNINSIHGLGVDASGRVYYTNDVGVSILPLPSCTGCPTESLGVAGLNVNQAFGLALAANGDVWVTAPSVSSYRDLTRTQQSGFFDAQVGNPSLTPFLVSNTGNRPLTVSSFAFTGAIYTVDPSSTCAAGTVLAAGSICSTVVKFAPLAAQSYSDNLTFTSNSLNATGSANVFAAQGQGVAPTTSATTTTLTASPSSVMLGAPVTLIATVTGSTGVPPTGMVNFLDGSTVIGSVALGPQNGNTSSALLITPAFGLAVGTHNFTAMYVGDSNFQASTSTVQTVNVTPAATTTTLNASGSNITFGQNETLTATISGFASPAMTGTVNFFDGTTAIGSGSVTSTSTGGTATLSFSNAPVGTHSFTATYNADANYLGSTSQPVSVTVGPAVVTISSQNFGSVAVGQTISMNVVFNQNSQFITALENTDFGVQSVNCSTTCTATVTFKPKFPGVREDAVTVSDSNGNLLAKTYVYGTGTGPQLGFDPGMNDTFSGTIQTPAGIAIGPQSTEYITDTSTKEIWSVSGSGVNRLPITSIGNPVAVAVDGGGIVYVADQVNNAIVTYNTQTSTQGTLATSGLSGPNGVAVDGAGNVYISDLNNNRIVEVDNQGNQTNLVTGLTSPQAVAVDSAGDVFYADLSNGGDIREHTVGGSTVGLVAVAGNIQGLALDASGKVYYTTDNGLRIFAPDGTFSFYGTSLAGSLTGVAVGPEGNVYVTQPATGTYIISVRLAGQGFPTGPAGSTSQSPFVVTNTGNAQLTIGNIAFTASTPYAIDSLSGCAAGTTIAAGLSCSGTIDFTPAAVQSYPSVMTVTSNSLNIAGFTNVDTLFGQGTPSVATSTTTTLSTSAANITAGQTETLTATIAGNTTNVLTGTVTFYEGTTSLGSSSVTATSTGATATLALSTLSVGTHQIIATYNGDANHLTSTSAPMTVTVTSPAPAVISSLNFGSVAVGQSASMNIVYTQGTNPTITAVNNLDFVVSTVNCTSSCTATVSFTPQLPGLRDDAVTVTDANGTLLAKTFIYGTGTAGQFGFLPGSSSINTSFTFPTSITFDAAGVGYLTDAATDKVYPLVTDAQPLPIAGLGKPGGIALDGAGTFYIADKDNNRIVTYNRFTNVQGVLATSPINNPSGVAVDGTGAVYIADTGTNRIIKVDNQGVESTVASANTPQAVAVDSANNLYYSDLANNGEIIELPAAGGSPITLVQFVGGTPLGIAVDASGSIYYDGANFSGIRDVLAGGASNGQIAFSDAVTGGHSGLALNANGDIWTMQSSNGVLESLHRATAVFTSSTSVGTPKQHTVQVVNTGNAPLTLSNVAFSDSTAFSLGSGSPCAAGTVLLPGSECDTPVVFNPPAPQTYTSFLNYTSDTLNVAGSVTTDGEVGTGTGSGPQTSTTTLTAASNNITAGQSAVITATVVSSGATTPTGTVSLFLGSTQLATGNLTPSGTAGTSTTVFTVASLNAGTYNFTATYSGDSAVQASTTSGPITVNVARIITSATLGVSAATITAGQSETLTATITGQASPAMGGAVTFFEGTRQIGQGNITATSTGGTATYTTTALAVGTHNITATYNGDANYTPSNSTAQTVTVNAPTVVVNSKSFGSLAVGQSTSMTLNYEQGSTVSATYNLDFAVSSSTCGTSCTATVSFTPQYPGQREDAIIVKDANGYPIAQTFVYGTGTAPQVAFDIGVQTTPITYGSSGTPGPLAVGPDGTYYVADTTNNQVKAFGSNGFATLNVGTIGTPAGLAVDGAGKVYVSDPVHNRVVYELNGVAGVVPVTFSQPSFLATDGAGNLYVLDNGFDHITKVDPQGNVSTVATTAQASVSGGFTVDAAGNIFYADGGQNDEVTEFGVFKTTNLLLSIDGIAVDAADRVYLSAIDPNTNRSAVALLSPGATSTVNYPISSSNALPPDIAVDQAGRILVSEPSIGQVDIYDRSTGNVSLTATAGSTAQSTITLSNTGNTPLLLSSLNVTGTGFSLASGGTCAVNASVSPAATCTVVVTFAPAAGQAYQGTLTIGSNSLNSSAAQNTFTLFGQGQSPVVMPTTTGLTVSSPTITAGQTETLTATITGGISPALTGTVNFFDGDNLIGSSSVSSVFTGGTATFSVSNLSVGQHQLSASYSGDTNYSQSNSAAVTVNVTPAPAVVTSQNFGSVAVGQSASMNIDYTAGTNPIIRATENRDFTVSAINCSGSCTATVTFKPQYPGRRSDLVTVKDSNGTVLAKTYVYGTGTGPQFGFDPGAISSSNGIEQPTGIAVDSQGEIYISDQSTNQVFLVADGISALPITNLGRPVGVAVDGGKVVYVADQTNNVIVTYDQNAGRQGTVTTTPLSGPTGVAVDGAGSLYITDTGNSRIIKIDRQGNETTIANGQPAVGPVAVDSAGDLFYATTADPGVIIERPGGDGEQVTVASNISNIHGLAVDASNRIYYTNDAGLSVLPLPSCSGCFIEGLAIGSSGTSKSGVALDGAGNIYVTSPGSSQYFVTNRSLESGSVTAAVGSSAQQDPFTVSNTGNAPLTISAFTIPVTVFSNDASSTCAAGTVIAPGFTCNTVIDFAPVAATTYNDPLTFTSNSLNVATSQNVFSEQGIGTPSVSPAPTSTTLTVSASTVAAGQSVTFTATVTASGNPVGNVNFLDGATLIGSAPVSSVGAGTAAAVFTTSALAVGSHSITAVYLGNSAFQSSTSAAQTVTVTALVPTLTSISPASALVNSAAVTITLTGTNFSTSDVVQLNGKAVASTFANATTLTAVIPANFLATAGTGQITVFDPVSTTTTAALPFVVTGTPAIVFSGPTTSNPAQQPTLTFVLTNPYPVAISGTLTLAFAPGGTAPVDDPNVQFASGGRAINFTIPALSTTTPSVQLQTGTVAGTVTVTLVVTANGINVTPASVTPVVITIPAVVPAISAASVVRSGTTLSVVIQGYSNTRELTTAIFHFVPADGSTISTPDITAPVTTVFATWFASAASAQYGSAFTYTQDFTLNNDASTIKSVTVTLVNSKGNSIQESAQ